LRFDGPALDGPNPNPTADRCTVTLYTTAPGRAVLSLLDLFGNRVGVPFSGDLARGKHPIEIETSRLANGTYTLVLEAAGIRRAMRFQVMR
jgi:hypothetical protein